MCAALAACGRCGIVAFELAQGELLSIIGPNGAGKTTLFNLISGHDVPDAGRIALDGVTIAGLPAERIAGLGLARTFQHGRVFATLSVRDNVLIGAHSRRMRFAVAAPSGAVGRVAAGGVAPWRRCTEEGVRLEAEVRSLSIVRRPAVAAA